MDRDSKCMGLVVCRSHPLTRRGLEDSVSNFNNEMVPPVPALSDLIRPALACQACPMGRPEPVRAKDYGPVLPDPGSGRMGHGPMDGPAISPYSGIYSELNTE